MALPQADEQRELLHLQPFIDELQAFVRRQDPSATFVLEPAPDPGIWLLTADVSPPLDQDLDFLKAITDKEVDLAIEHAVNISTLLRPRASSAI